MVSRLKKKNWWRLKLEIGVLAITGNAIEILVSLQTSYISN